MKQLDPLGFVLIAPAIVCLQFALEFGGVQYPWNSGRIIALLVLFGFFGSAFVASQLWLGDAATVPTRIVRQRTMIAATVASVSTGSLLVIYPFYLPIWFQAIQGKAPQSSGLSLIPLLLSQVLLVIIGGILTSKVGYYTPLIILGGAVSIVGAALISTWEVDIGHSKWIGYQVSLWYSHGTW